MFTSNNNKKQLTWLDNDPDKDFFHVFLYVLFKQNKFKRTQKQVRYFKNIYTLSGMFFSSSLEIVSKVMLPQRSWTEDWMNLLN